MDDDIDVTEVVTWRVLRTRRGVRALVLIGTVLAAIAVWWAIDEWVHEIDDTSVAVGVLLFLLIRDLPEVLIGKAETIESGVGIPDEDTFRRGMSE